MYGFGFCEIPIVLQVIRFIKILINIVRFIVPIGLIIMVSLDFGKGIINGDKKPGEIIKLCSNRIIAAVVIFLIPTIVGFVLGLVDRVTSYESCWSNAEVTIIEKYQLLWDEAVAKKEEEERKQKEEERRKEEEAKKKEENRKEELNNQNFGTGGITFSKNITFSYKYEKYDNKLSYGLYTPSSASSNKSSGLLIWLHGSGERGSGVNISNAGLLKVLDTWDLDNFNAYILCPHLLYSKDEWANSASKTSLYNLIAKIIKENNIDSEKIVLSGHSMGAIGVFYMASGKTDFYSSLAVLSGYPTVDLNQFKNMPVRGYVGKTSSGEDSNSYNYMNTTFINTFGKDNLFVYEASHAGLVKTAFTRDDNRNNRSDLIEWMFNPNNNNSGNDSSSGGSTNNQKIELLSINTKDLGCTLYYDRYNKTVMDKLYIRKDEADNLHSALAGACSYVKSLGYNYIQTAGAYVGRDGGPNDYHAKALAIDLNNQWSYETKDGIKYTPYTGQGNNTWNTYKKFICNVCDGKENCKYNINYIIYTKYFKNKGWCWGGNWGPTYFDPMHFEKTSGGCSVANKKEITCD